MQLEKDTMDQTVLLMARPVHEDLCKGFTGIDHMGFQSDPCELCCALR